VQTVDARVFEDDEVRMLVDAASEVAPVVSEARTLDRFIAPSQERLWALARNLWWSWDHNSTSLFHDLDPDQWRKLNHNPIVLLASLALPEIDRRATQLVLHSRINYAYRRQREYLMGEHTWGETHAGVLRARPVAYFSAEFGLHESMPIYSGGLGILAGDHIKSASDLGIPLVGIGLFYGQGYFKQRLDGDGWQQEEYIENDAECCRWKTPSARPESPLSSRWKLAVSDSHRVAEAWPMRSVAPGFQRGGQRAGRS
jgi:starch phosphorylase